MTSQFFAVNSEDGLVSFDTLAQEIRPTDFVDDTRSVDGQRFETPGADACSQMQMYSPAARAAPVRVGRVWHADGQAGGVDHAAGMTCSLQDVEDSGELRFDLRWAHGCNQELEDAVGWFHVL
ncbi:MAG: hypothetical protein AUI63_02175 [Gemmatimonadetes bacterium 13_1_40CM_2_60_3]|nr:MAG: hypothetical protein AUI63_02175 [Gemmatimonadetes bacterium 13_1_40CM_2_60_3]